PPQRRVVHRPHFPPQAPARHQEIRQGRQARGGLMALRLIFMGTPDFAVPTLCEIVGRGHEVVAVYTRAPKPAGRGMALQPSPVEREARRVGFFRPAPKALRADEALAEFRAHQADAAVVVAYGLILPVPILG